MPFIIKALFRFPSDIYSYYGGEWKHPNGELCSRREKLYIAWRMSSLGECVRYRVWR